MGLGFKAVGLMGVGFRVRVFKSSLWVWGFGSVGLRVEGSGLIYL